MRDMTISRRLEWARNVIIIQLILNVALVVIGAIAGISLSVEGLLSESIGVGNYAIPVVLAMILGFMGIILPLVVLYGLNQRSQVWGIAVYALLAYQVFTGGGIMSILPLIALILLIDRETFNTLTRDEYRSSLVS